MKVLKSGKDGFTLVEILVVIAITAFVGTIMVMIFINTLRGSNKSKILANIKQNGQAVLESMDKTIRGADNVVCRSSDGNTLVVLKYGLYIRFKIFPQTSSTNGSIRQDILTPPTTKLSDFVDNVCDDISVPPQPERTPQTLTDTNSQTGVSVQIPPTPFFTVNTQAGSKDIVTIQFQLGPAVGIKSQIDPVTFQTTVQLR